jgi:UDP-2,3-diacylglucosamine pyrophosphatase LpxH
MREEGVAMPGRFKIVVSDLHMGAGRVTEGNSLEDFISDHELAAFLEEIADESDRDGAEVELIVNGDAFEMLQVPHVDRFDPAAVYPPQDYHSSSEKDSARKMQIIIDGHRPFFDALGRLVRVGPPRRAVTFIKGNHDVNLHWPAVQDRIRSAMGATGGRRPLLAFEERCVSREGIYVEHGNQYAEAVDRFQDMEEPHDHERPGQLATPLGSWFVMDVFNQVEREKYWIDGVKPITALVWYALAYDFAFAARAIATAVRALPGIVVEGVLDVQDPRADLARQLEDPDRVQELAAMYDEDESFRLEFNAYVAGILAPPPELPGIDAMPLAASPDPVGMGDQIRERVTSSLFGIASSRAIEEGAELVTFGHTHDAGVEELPDGRVYINSGTWTWRADFSGVGKETWQDLFEHPERFSEDRVLTYVRIDYDDGGQPAGRLLVYQPGEGPALRPSPAPQPSFWEPVRAWLDWLRKRLTGGD